MKTFHSYFKEKLITDDNIKKRFEHLNKLFAPFGYKIIIRGLCAYRFVSLDKTKYPELEEDTQEFINPWMALNTPDDEFIEILKRNIHAGIPKTIRGVPNIFLPPVGVLLYYGDLGGYIDHNGELIFDRNEIPWVGSVDRDESRPPDKIIRKFGKTYSVSYYHEGGVMGISELEGD
jgi:hypothetical protein